MLNPLTNPAERERDEDGQQEPDLLRGLEAEEVGEILDGGHGCPRRIFLAFTRPLSLLSCLEMIFPPSHRSIHHPAREYRPPCPDHRRRSVRPRRESLTSRWVAVFTMVMVSPSCPFPPQPRYAFAETGERTGDGGDDPDGADEKHEDFGPPNHAPSLPSFASLSYHSAHATSCLRSKQVAQRSASVPA